MSVKLNVDLLNVGNTFLTEEDAKNIANVVMGRLRRDAYNKQALEILGKIKGYHSISIKLVDSWTETFHESLSAYVYDGQINIMIRPDRSMPDAIWLAMNKDGRNAVADAMVETILSRINAIWTCTINHRIDGDGERFMVKTRSDDFENMSLRVVVEYKRCALKEIKYEATRYEPDCSGE